MRQMRTLLATLSFAAAALAATALPAGAAPASIVIRLTPDQTHVEVVEVPTGTAKVNVAYLNSAETVTKYRWPLLTASEAMTPYKPPDGYPVVDMEARDSANKALGTWASVAAGHRYRTVAEPPAEESQAEREAREAREREAKERAEREARERAEREAREREEREAKEREEREHPSTMAVGLDTGGWTSESQINDFAGAVKFIRSNAHSYDDTHMGYLAKAGVSLMPLFEDRGNGAPPADPSAEALSWCKRYCKGGTFWQGRLSDLGATTLEVINEPGNPYFWGSNARNEYARYGAIVEHVAATLTAGLPATQPQPRLLVSMDGGFEGDQYGRNVVKAHPNVASLNVGWTVHPYGGKSSRSQSALGGRVRVTESFRPVFVSEVGWPTCVGCANTGDSLQWTESEQASNIVTFIRWSRSLTYVLAVHIFNYRDYGTNNWYGIESSSGRRKASYYALPGA